MADLPDPTPKRRFPWMRIVLVVSLALNLLVVGLVAGSMLGKDRRDGPQGLRSIGLGPFAMALPEKDRREIRAALRRDAAPFAENRRAIRREIEALVEILEGETLDEADLRAAVDRQRDRVAERLALGSDVFVAQIVRMTAEERASYAAGLDHMLSRGPGRSDDAQP